MKTNIKQLRILRGYTQAQLAALVDVSESAISQYESGKKIPSTETLYKLGEALDCPVSDILDDRKSVEFSLSTLEREFIHKFSIYQTHFFGNENGNKKTRLEDIQAGIFSFICFGNRSPC